MPFDLWIHNHRVCFTGVQLYGARYATKLVYANYSTYSNP